jgi:hypothetical protein
MAAHDRDLTANIAHEILTESLALLACYVSVSCQLEAITRELSRFKEGPPRDVRRGELLLATQLRLAPSCNDRDRTTVRARRAAQSNGPKKWE